MHPLELQSPVPAAFHQSSIRRGESSTLATGSSTEHFPAHPELQEGDFMGNTHTCNVEDACEKVSSGEERDQCRCSGGEDASARERGSRQDPGGGGVEDDCAEDRSSIGDVATECAYLTLWRADLFAIARAQHSYLARRSQMTCT